MTMRTRPDPVRLRAALRKLLAARAEIDFAYLFRSSAVGLPYDDLDVAIFLRAAPATVFDYEMDLSVELTRACLVDVDVHVLNNAPWNVQHAALEGRPLLVRDEEHLAAFIRGVETRVIGSGCPFDPYLGEA